MGKNFLLLMAPLLAGCSLLLPQEQAAPPWVPVQASAALGEVPGLRQVAVLPFEVQDALPADAERIQQAVVLSLRESAFPSVRALTRRELGRSAIDVIDWSGRLPLETLIRLHRDFSSEVAMFGTVTYIRTTGEPAIGLKLTLVDTRDGRVLWSADDVVDAKTPQVRASLRSYWRRAGTTIDTLGQDATQVPLDTFARFVARSFVLALRPPAAPRPPPGEADTAALAASRTSEKGL